MKGSVESISSFAVICMVYCSDFPGDNSRGWRGSSMVRSESSDTSNLNFAVSQLSVSVVTVTVTAQLTPVWGKMCVTFGLIKCMGRDL